MYTVMSDLLNDVLAMPVISSGPCLLSDKIIFLLHATQAPQARFYKLAIYYKQCTLMKGYVGLHQLRVDDVNKTARVGKT